MEIYEKVNNFKKKAQGDDLSKAQPDDVIMYFTYKLEESTKVLNRLTIVLIIITVVLAVMTGYRIWFGM